MRLIEAAATMGGMCFFDPGRLEASFPEAEDLLKRFQSDEGGESVVKNGTVLPMLNVDDGTYRVYVRHSSEPPVLSECWLVHTSRGRRLRVSSGLVVGGGLDLLAYWRVDPLPQAFDLPSALYSVEVRGFQVLGTWPNKTLEDVAYELVLTEVGTDAETTSFFADDLSLLDWQPGQP
jgi:hypothetical protein